MKTILQSRSSRLGHRTYEFACFAFKLLARAWHAQRHPLQNLSKLEATSEANFGTVHQYQAHVDMAQASPSSAPSQSPEDGVPEGTAGCAEDAAHGDGPAESASGDCSTIADGIGLRLAEMLAAS